MKGDDSHPEHVGIHGHHGMLMAEPSLFFTVQRHIQVCAEELFELGKLRVQFRLLFYYSLLMWFHVDGVTS
jgi:hypothetical protein